MSKLGNIYKTARENIGITQETAAEQLDLSSESIRAYETDRRTPPDTIVIRMAELYHNPYLIYEHSQSKTLVGNKILPELEIKNLAEAVLTFIDECEDLKTIKKMMVKISRDGEIDDTERPAWDMILKKIDELIIAGITLKFIN